MKEINEAVKEENKRNQKDMDNAGIKDAKKMSNPNYLKNMQSQYTPKMPSMPSMPSFKPPKI
jgi:hypothetical protein